MSRPAASSPAVALAMGACFLIANAALGSPATAGSGGPSAPAATPAAPSIAPVRVPDTVRAASPAPRPNGAGAKPDSAKRVLAADSAARRAPDTAAIRQRRDSLARADSLRRAGDRARFLARWRPAPDLRPCPELADAALACLREAAGFAGFSGFAAQDLGFPGMRDRLFDLARETPIGFASPFTPPPEYDPYGAAGLAPPAYIRPRGLGGPRVGAEEAFQPILPLDTPVTVLDWERGALGLNVFHLNLRRMVGQHSYLALDYYSNSGDSGYYDYQFQVHQPYINGPGELIPYFKRDSASVVIQGDQPPISAIDLRPRLGFWLDSNQILELVFDHYRNSTGLARPLGDTRDMDLYVDTLQHNLPGALTSYGYGAQYQYRNHGLRAEAGLSRASSSEAGTGEAAGIRPALDLDVDRAWAVWSRADLPGDPTLRASARDDYGRGEFYGDSAALAADRPATRMWIHQENLGFSARPGFGWWGLGAGGGLANQGLPGRAVRGYDYGLEAWADLPGGIGFEAGQALVSDLPDARRLFVYDPVLGYFPSPGLDPAREFTARGEAQWHPFGSDSALDAHAPGGARGFGLALGVDLDFLRDAWAPAVLPFANPCAEVSDTLYGACASQGGDTYPDTTVLPFANYRSGERHNWHWSAFAKFGHWELRLRDQYLFRNQLRDPRLLRPEPDPTAYPWIHQGRLAWGRGLLDGKLDLTLAGDWEWWGPRRAWAPRLDGASEPVRLDQWLDLDFSVYARIKTFLFYFRAMNLNHDRYYPEPGVHPPGINFRFGADWTLKG